MKRLSTVLTITVLLGLVLAACAPAVTPTPETIKETVIVQVEVTPPPPPAAPTEMTVLIRMMDMQDAWFRDELIPAAEEALGIKLNVVTFDKIEDIEVMVGLEIRSGNHTIGLVKTESTEILPMVALEYMTPLEDIVSGDDLAEAQAEYVDAAWEFGVVDGKAYYIPRKLETVIWWYLKSTADDAVANWESMKGDIDAMFAAYNGYGLPAGYEFEADPNEWDFYDLAVYAYYWANTPGADGLTKARLSHRGKDYGGTSSELMTMVYELGGDADDVLAMDTDPVIDMFEWEAFFVHNGLYDSGMWEEAWSGGGIWGALSAGRVYAARHMHQIDCFFIHGGTHPDLAGYLTDPDDQAVAMVNMGVSLELDADGNPVREGSHTSNFTGWWWGIPVTSPDAQKSYELARFITNAEWHGKECATFGMMPVRNDIYADLAGAFPEEWMQTVFDTSLAQMDEGTVRHPAVPTIADISQLYRNAWYDICTGGNYALNPAAGPDRAYIESVLSTDYAPAVQALAGD